MLGRLYPRSLANAFQGSWAAPFLLDSPPSNACPRFCGWTDDLSMGGER